jgi:hypothetical protein
MEKCKVLLVMSQEEAIELLCTLNAAARFCLLDVCRRNGQTDILPTIRQRLEQDICDARRDDQERDNAPPDL